MERKLLLSQFPIKQRGTPPPLRHVCSEKEQQVTEYERLPLILTKGIFAVFMVFLLVIYSSNDLSALSPI